MTEKHMFVSDLDGTLFRSDRRFSNKDLDRLTLLGEMGITRVLATGRSVFSLLRSVPEPLPFDYLIFSTGLGIAHYPDSNQRIIKSHGLTEEQTTEVTELFKELSLDFMIHDPLPHNHAFTFDYPSGNNPDFMTRIGFYENHYREMGNGGGKPGPSSQFITMVPAPPSGLDLYHHIKERLDQFSVIKTTSPFDGKTMWIEVFPKNVSKGNAVLWLADRIGIDRKNIAAVGNDYNDEDLLEIAEKAYVVENAPEDLKRRFTVVSSNDNEGVSDAVMAAFGV